MMVRCPEGKTPGETHRDISTDTSASILGDRSSKCESRRSISRNDTKSRANGVVYS